MNLINEIIDAIGVSLNEEFGDAYKVYPENQKQGFEEPCFYVQCINHTHSHFLGLKEYKTRYKRENQFCIQYFPENLQRAREEIHSVCEQMEFCLEWVTVTGDLVMGTNMHYEITDDILSFFVDYNLFIHTDPEITEMEELSIDQDVRDER